MSEQMVDISFPVNKNLLLSLKETKDEFTQDVLYFSALFFYRKRKLSLGKAAELAGYNKMDFIQKLQEEKETIFDYSESEIDEIFDDVSKIK
jgi:predicted HTH domain antitoxin